ncbi:MbnP family protein [Pseudofulvibacter geojedonensis]|uniref:MbnP family protein n=1 Tax=Pseudofulvibacter geojedonensis TaxID=1123758 RepID=A0ABW3I3S5_9FLAO
MKKVIYLLCLSVFLFSCSDDDDTKKEVSLTMNFTHNWEGTTISSLGTSLDYTNANGENLSIERLRYLISNVTLRREGSSDIVLNGYNLVDVGEGTGLSYNPSTTISPGTYNLSFTFGFNNEDNQSGIYADLNTANFNVPDMMGGGYHYMQMDGKFMNSSNDETGYNFHAIRAVDNPGMNPTFPQDTFFTVNLGTVVLTDDSTVEVQANIAEWFKNPNTWNLNTLHQMLMPNSNAQIMMYQNGQDVFSLAQ